jgi:hypothetical protein
MRSSWVIEHRTAIGKVATVLDLIFDLTRYTQRDTFLGDKRIRYYDKDIFIQEKFIIHG